MAKFNTTAARRILAALDSVPREVKERKVFRIVPESRNKKTGRTFQTYTSASLCPERCAFKRYGGCYACAVNTRKVWETADRDTLEDLAIQLISHSGDTAASGAFVRHSIAGDIALAGTSSLDMRLLDALADLYGAAGVKAVSYTHCKISVSLDRIAVLSAMKKGFVLNASAESTAYAERCFLAGIPAVIAVPEGEKSPEKTPNGIAVTQCPAQKIAGITCAKCGLCAKANRKFIIAFKAHGYAHKKASRAIQLAREEDKQE